MGKHIYIKLACLNKRLSTETMTPFMMTLYRGGTHFQNMARFTGTAALCKLRWTPCSALQLPTLSIRELATSSKLDAIGSPKKGVERFWNENNFLNRDLLPVLGVKMKHVMVLSSIGPLYLLA